MLLISCNQQSNRITFEVKLFLLNALRIPIKGYKKGIITRRNKEIEIKPKNKQ